MTTNATDATGYHLNASNRETVRLVIERISGNTPLSVAGSFHRGLTIREGAVLGLQAGENGRVWNLPNANMLGQEARPGDRIRQTDGTSWRIIDAANVTFGSRWRCVCVRERENNED